MLKIINFEYFYDENYINELILYLIKNYELFDYVNDINIVNEYHKSNCANYIPNSKTLNLYIKSIYQSFYMFYTQYKIANDKNDLNRTYSIYLLKIILHELSHVLQFKEYHKENTDSLGIIIKEGIELGKRCPDKLNIREKNVI